jgi:RNA polymerase sigma-70 factor (ECF subfamily)
LWCIAAAIVMDRAAADDVLQEAAMIALGKLSQFDARTSFAAWMAQVVRFVALNHARRRQRHAAVPLESVQVQRGILARPDSPPAGSHMPISSRGSLVTDQDAFDDRVITALHSLDETARSCLLLRVLVDLPYKEIAHSLDIPEGTAMSHVHRARTHLRQRLTEEPLHHHDRGGGNP